MTVYPTLFEIGNFQVSTFGLMVGVGFLAAGQMAAVAFEREGLSRDSAWRVVVWCLVGGLVGAKLWYVLEQIARGAPGSLLQHLLSRGGLTWYGGLLGGVIAALLCIRVAKLPWLTVFDCAAPTLAIGQAIGRIGCFLVGDDYGRVTDVPWGVAFPRGLPPTIEPVHPTMLYEILWLVPLGIFLWRRRGRSRFLLGEYLMLAGLGRLWIEGFRINPPLLGPLSNAQVTALACIAIGGFAWLWFRRRGGPLSRSATA